MGTEQDFQFVTQEARDLADQAYAPKIAQECLDLRARVATLEAELEPHHRHDALTGAGWLWLVARGYIAPTHYGHGRRCFSQSEAWELYSAGGDEPEGGEVVVAPAKPPTVKEIADWIRHEGKARNMQAFQEGSWMAVAETIEAHFKEDGT